MGVGLPVHNALGVHGKNQTFLVSKKIGCNGTEIYRLVLRISNKANIFRQMNVMRIECMDV